jgi:hypothetical protein
MEALVDRISGALALKDWFGYWPNFHDAEVISLSLIAGAPTSLRVTTWDTSSQLDERGYFGRSKFVTVEFVMESITSCSLFDVDVIPAIIFGLEIVRSGDLWTIVLDPCYGMYGTLTARDIRISLTPCTTPQQYQ